MIRVPEITLPLSCGMDEIRKEAARKLKIDDHHIKTLYLVKKSVDARKKQDVKFVYTAAVDVGKEEDRILKRNHNSKITKEPQFSYAVKKCAKPQVSPAVIGFGPAGMFAALIMAQAGLCPIVFERGYDVETRTEAVLKLKKQGVLDPCSNVQFGEGGAGTFSDGKLNTGVNDLRIRKIFEEFVRFGAPEEILYEAKPHVGTDLLSGIVKRIREEIIRLGGEVRFGEQLTGITEKNGKVCEIEITPIGKEPYRCKCDFLVLSVGHSARDTFKMLYEKGLPMTQKVFSVGARIEHPQKLINKAQYGAFWNHPALGAADYKLSAHMPDGRGVYTFCMCPGGEVVCAASEENTVVTNGMSEFARSAQNANAALLVNVSGEDFGSSDPLAGIAFQRMLEKKAFEMGGGGYHAPCQRVEDFLKGQKGSLSSSISPSYRPGVTASDLKEGLSEPIVRAMQQGILQFDQKLHGFAFADALLTGYETRSSSPVRILRGEDLQSPVMEGLFPCGEGAGYAGGIVSAAVDGIKCAEKIIDKY